MAGSSPPAAAARLRLLWWLAAAVVVLEIWVLLIVLPLRPSGFALQFASTPRNFGDIVHVWSAEQLARYRSHLLVDALLLLAYGSFGWLCVQRCRFYHRLGSALRTLTSWLLPLAALFDAAENALHWWLTEIPRFGVPSAYLASAGCAGVKWLLLLIFAALSLWTWARSESSGDTVARAP